MPRGPVVRLRHVRRAAAAGEAVTREEIRLTLAAINGEGPSDGPPASASSRLLAAVVEDQEERLIAIDLRLRALEGGSR